MGWTSSKLAFLGNSYADLGAGTSFGTSNMTSLTITGGGSSPVQSAITSISCGWEKCVIQVDITIGTSIEKWEKGKNYRTDWESSNNII